MGLDPSSDAGFYSSLIAHPKTDADEKANAWVLVERFARDEASCREWMTNRPGERQIAAAKAYWDYQETRRRQKIGNHPIQVIENFGNLLGEHAAFMVPFLAAEMRAWFAGRETTLGSDLPRGLEVLIRIAPGGGAETKKVLEEAKQFNYGGSEENKKKYVALIEAALKKFP